MKTEAEKKIEAKEEKQDAREIKMDVLQNKLQLKEDTVILKLHKVKNVLNSDNIKNTKTSVNEIPEKDGSLENVLSELKLSGRYHLKFLLLIALLAAINSEHSINYIFSAENIDYRCKYSNCNATTLLKLEQNSTIDYKCTKYDLFDHNGTCTADNFDTAVPSDCSEWVYEKPNTFVAEFNLGCQDWKRTLVGTMHSAGFMTGLLLIGPLSDKIGRKKLIIFNIVAAGILGISKSLVSSYWVFIALEFLEPMLGDCYAATFTMAIEMVTRKHRPAIMLLFSICSTVGQILLAVFAYLTPSWRIFLLCVYAPALLYILYIFLLDESLRWLLIKGKKSQAENIIREAAKINKITIDERKIVNLNCEDTSSGASLGSSIKITISSRKLFLRLLICLCIWFTTLFNTYSLLINSVSLEGNKYINYGLVSLSGTLGGFILLYVLTKFKRKGPLILALTLTGAFCVSQSFVSREYRWLSTLLYLCGKVNTTVSLRISYLYTTELFPTYTRNTMLALCSSVGRIGAILAPQTPLLLKYWSGLPSLLVGVLSLMTASVVTFMPDTSEDVLPDNVKQAEAVGTRQKNKDVASRL